MWYYNIILALFLLQENNNKACHCKNITIEARIEKDLVKVKVVNMNLLPVKFYSNSRKIGTVLYEGNYALNFIEADPNYYTLHAGKCFLHLVKFKGKYVDFVVE